MCRKFCAITSSFAARPGNVETPVWPDLRPTTFTLASFKKIYQLFFPNYTLFSRNILLRFITSVFHNHSSNVKSFFSLIPYNGPFQIVATLVLWSMHPSLLEKPFLEWLDPAISWESFSSKSGTEHQEQLWSCKRRNATKLFVLWQRVFHNQFDLPNKRIRLSKWFDERCLIDRQWGIGKVNTCVQ